MKQFFLFCLAVLGMSVCLVARAESVSQAMQRISHGAHSLMPPSIMQQTSGPVGNGMTVENGTPYALKIYFKGPISKVLTIAPHHSMGVRLLVGAYQVAVEAKSPRYIRILPFYGRQQYQANAHYWLKLYLR